MSASLHDKVLAYLRECNVMTLATTGEQGLWAAAVFYVNHGFTLYFLSAPTSRHCMNIESHPGASATIQEDYKDWRDIKGIQLEGESRRVEGEEKAKAMTRYGAKFAEILDQTKAPPEIVTAIDRIAWYKVVPTRLYFIDNSLGLGHRDEVPLRSAGDS